uniref:Uncharacterized protein n=1 Tax=Octopus bimaculoides TaxID=37653 RepID=A0A0L8GSH8_OCTBM
MPCHSQFHFYYYHHNSFLLSAYPNQLPCHLSCSHFYSPAGSTTDCLQTYSFYFCLGRCYYLMAAVKLSYPDYHMLGSYSCLSHTNFDHHLPNLKQKSSLFLTE